MMPPELARLLALLWLATGCHAPTTDRAPLEPTSEAQAKGVLDPAQRYSVRVGRPLKVGERYRTRVRETVQIDERTQIEGEPDTVSRDREERIFEGTGKVTTVDTEGVEKAFEYRVGKLVSVVKGKELRLSEGATIRVVRAATPEEATVEIDGRAATPDERNAVGFFVSLTREAASEDSIFGSREPVRVGDKWRPNLEVFLKGSELVIPRDGVTGSMQLVGIRRSPLGDLREVRFEVSITNPLPKGLPPDAEPGPGSATQVITGVIMPDGLRVESTSTSTHHMELRFRGSKVKPSSFTYDETRTLEERLELL